MEKSPELLASLLFWIPAHWPDTRIDQTVMLQQRARANIHPISLCVCCHRAPTKIGVSADVAPDLPDTSSPPPHGSHCRLSLTRYCSSQHQQLQLRYHMQAPFNQARLSGINKADWDRTTHHRPVSCPDRPDLVGEVVHSHCRSFSSRSRCRSS